MSNLDASQLNLSVDVGQLGKFLESVVSAVKANEEKLTAMEAAQTAAKEQQESKSNEKEAALKELIESQSKKISELSEKLATLESLSGGEKLKTFEGKMADLTDRTAASEVSCKSIEKVLADVRQNIATLERTTHDMSDFSSQTKSDSKKVDETFAALSSRLGEAESSIKAIHDDFDAAESELALRYDAMRNDLKGTLTRIAEEQGAFLERQDSARLPMDKYLEDSNRMIKALVSSAQKTIASAKFDVNRRKAVENMMLAWNHQVGLSHKRNLGTRSLKRELMKKVGSHFSAWKWQTKLDSVVQGFHEAIDEKIPTAEEIMGGTGFPARVDELEVKVSEHAANIATTQQLDEVKNSMLELVSGHVAALTAAISGGRAEDQESNGSKFTEIFSTLASLSASLSALKEYSETAVGRLDGGEFATAKELQKIMTDVLLLWNAMKQLDASKAEKREFEQLALEISNKAALSTHLQPSADSVKRGSSLPSVTSSEDTSNFKMEISSQNERITNVQSMLLALAEFVEELVMRMANMKGIESNRLPVFPHTLVRTGGGFRDMQSSDVQVVGGGGASHDEVNTSESMDRFLRYARSLVSNSADFARPKNVSRRPASGLKRDLVLPSELRVDGNTARRF